MISASPGGVKDQELYRVPGLVSAYVVPFDNLYRAEDPLAAVASTHERRAAGDAIATLHRNRFARWVESTSEYSVGAAVEVVQPLRKELTEERGPRSQHEVPTGSAIDPRHFLEQLESGQRIRFHPAIRCGKPNAIEPHSRHRFHDGFGEAALLLAPWTVLPEDGCDLFDGVQQRNEGGLGHADFLSESVFPGSGLQLLEPAVTASLRPNTSSPPASRKATTAS